MKDREAVEGRRLPSRAHKEEARRETGVQARSGNAQQGDDAEARRKGTRMPRAAPRGQRGADVETTYYRSSTGTSLRVLSKQSLQCRSSQPIVVLRPPPPQALREMREAERARNADATAERSRRRPGASGATKQIRAAQAAPASG